MQGSATIIKVCGMRDASNIRAVEAAGPDLMGFICWPGSKRYVAVRPEHMPACKRVGVFVDPTVAQVQEACTMLGLDYAQLHGHESPSVCQDIAKATGLTVIKAISVLTADNVRQAKAYEGAVGLLLFDTKCTCMGGSGQQFDWDVLQTYEGNTPFLLSGGIGPEDVQRLRSWHHPRCVGLDVNSRFELSPAFKDSQLLSEFIRNIKKS